MSTTTPVTIDVPRFIADRKVGGFQWLVVALCTLTVFLDGYDTQSVAFVAPSIASEWHLSHAQLGPLFTASLVGLLLGALGFGLIADRIGRRRMVIACTATFGAFTLATAFSDNLTQLLVLRFIAGLGLGGGMPNAIALTAEYCPERRRATLVMLMFTGFSLGAAASGGVATAAIPSWGWRAVWYVGGIVPLLLVLVQLWLLPESIRFLMVQNAPREQVRRLLARIDRTAVIPPTARLDAGEPAAPGVPVVQLFAGRRALGTVLLWTMFFMNLLALFFLQNWIPVISHGSGISVQTAVLIGTLFQVGGTVACLVVGFPIDRFGPFRVMPFMYGAGCLLVIVLGRAGAEVPMLMALTFLAGFCVVGGQNAANALAAIFYPTAIRSTGVGWSLGIGRIGAIIGPLLGGFLLSLQWPTPSIFLIGAIPLAVAALACACMGLRYSKVI
jgi:AAHS family 4-hydroxybenzoate transporter-like MFS transporter